MPHSLGQRGDEHGKLAVGITDMAKIEIGDGPPFAVRQELRTHQIAGAKSKVLVSGHMALQEDRDPLAFD